MSGDIELYQNNGYVFVAVDCRGRGKSEGVWSGFADDVPDTHDVIEWVAAQPWCNGKVGTTGLSYMGWVQWAAASARPAHLCAMVSTSAAGRWQQEIPYTNGIFQLYFAWWAYITRRRIDEGYGLRQIDWDEALRILPFKDIGRIIDTPTDTWDNLADRDTLDDYWKSLRFDDRYDQIDVPCLHVTGWYDQEDLLGAFHHYEHMMADSPARDKQYLIVGPWSHVKSRSPIVSTPTSITVPRRHSPWTTSTWRSSTTGSRASTTASASSTACGSSSPAATPGAPPSAGPRRRRTSMSSSARAR